MGVEAEAAVRAFIDEMDGDWSDSDLIERLLGRMAADARYYVVAWHEPLVGHDAIRTELVRQGTRVSDVHVEIVAIASTAGTVFTERLDSMIMDGTPGTYHVAGIFKLDDNGKIAVWRDYVDTREVVANLRRAGGG
jgi:limonene-1,2-epoxide hydrolase